MYSGLYKGGYQAYQSKNNVTTQRFIDLRSGYTPWFLENESMHGNEFIVEMLIYRLNETQILMGGYKDGHRMEYPYLKWDIQFEFKKSSEHKDNKNKNKNTDDMFYMFVEINAKEFELLQIV